MDCRLRPVRTWLARSHGLGTLGSQALAAIISNGAVDHGAAIDAFPCIEDEKEVREPFQHHHPFALRTFHGSLPGGGVHS